MPSTLVKSPKDYLLKMDAKWSSFIYNWSHILEEEFFCTLEGVFFNFLRAKKKLYIELSQIVELYKTKIHFLVLKVHLSTLSQQNDIEEDALCAGMEILAWFLVEGKYY